MKWAAGRPRLVHLQDRQIGDRIGADDGGRELLPRLQRDGDLVRQELASAALLTHHVVVRNDHAVGRHDDSRPLGRVVLSAEDARDRSLDAHVHHAGADILGHPDGRTHQQIGGRPGSRPVEPEVLVTPDTLVVVVPVASAPFSATSAHPTAPRNITANNAIDAITTHRGRSLRPRATGVPDPRPDHLAITRSLLTRPAHAADDRMLPRCLPRRAGFNVAPARHPKERKV